MRRVVVVIVFLLLGAGCAPSISRHSIETGLRLYSVEPLISEMEQDTNAKTEYWYWLNLGRLYQLNGQFVKSIGAYDKAEAIIVEYESRAIVGARNVSASAGALLFSKGAERYFGKGYERSLMHTLSADAKNGEIVLISYISENNVRLDYVSY
ncbi:MAG: hypothetical protein HQL06_06015 [Nitrospirae bacterium]|nr:hypothetical protein [Nitrospirota bacterium]